MEILNSSFRDPSGFLFLLNGELFRRINDSYRGHYDLLMSSGLYENLSSRGLLITHRDTAGQPAPPAFKTIKPDLVPFISYPYEWCFSQLKDAALATIEIQKTALKYGMILKDASAYNIQFLNGAPTLIDTLSFEKYEEGKPWIAYRQFCQHFLAPLALMALRDIRLNQLLRIYLDGVPLDLASSLLPWPSRFNFNLQIHIHAHAKMQKRHAGTKQKPSTAKVSKQGLAGIVDSLESSVRNLRWAPESTEWGDYYSDTNYSAQSIENKRKIVETLIEKSAPKSLWDMGANTGLFSRIASAKGIETVAFDIDPAAVEKNYLACKNSGEKHLLPLLLDLTNPSPDIGWRNLERTTILKRGRADTILALALVHHLAISNNTPLGLIASFFSDACDSLIIEFIPKTDSQAQRLLSSREDIFHDYTQQSFEREFGALFTIKESIPVRDSQRTIYLMAGKPR